MAATLHITAELIIAFVFYVSTAAKISNPQQFYEGIREYRLLPDWTASGAGALIILLEALVSITHLTGYLLNVMAPMGLFLILLFGVGVSIILSRGERVECHCFGETKEKVSLRTLARLVLLMFCELTIIF